MSRTRFCTCTTGSTSRFVLLTPPHSGNAEYVKQLISQPLLGGMRQYDWLQLLLGLSLEFMQVHASMWPAPSSFRSALAIYCWGTTKPLTLCLVCRCTKVSQGASGCAATWWFGAFQARIQCLPWRKARPTSQLPRHTAGNSR